MPNATAIPREDVGKLARLQHLNAHLSSYAATLEISADDLAQLQAGSAILITSSRCKTPPKIGSGTRDLIIMGTDNLLENESYILTVSDSLAAPQSVDINITTHSK